MNSSSGERPAILGGNPIRPAGPPIWPRNDPQVRATLLKLFETGDWGRYHGPNVLSLCQKLAGYFELEHVLPCSSGTAAVELALRGSKVTDGDEVILAGYDFKANFQNILCLGATPVLVDLDPVTWQLDHNRLDAAISNKTRAILISHLHGGVVDAPQVRQIADAHGLMLIEDICQNPGAILYGQKAGTWGDVSVLSFGGSKLLTSGRGGAVLTRRSDIAERIKRYVNRGNDAYPLSEIQAAIVLSQIDELDHWNTRRRTAVEKLALELEELSGLTILQRPTADLTPAYYKVGFRYDADQFDGLPRELFATSLRAEGIAMDVGFRGLHLIHSSRRFRAADSLVQASLADTGMLILHHPVLIQEGDAIHEIADAVSRIAKWADLIRSEEWNGKGQGPNPIHDQSD